MMPTLEARRLTLSWDGGATIVARDVSLSVSEGQTVCLVGRSGCGKTTILYALSGLSKPLEGQVLLQNEDVTGIPGRVSYMLQKDLLMPHLRILENAALPLVLGGMAKAEAHERARALFDRFGLAGTEEAWPSELSGGMRQRAAFLRTYLMGNKAVLLDEPFSALDALTRVELRRWYARMAEELGIASVVITHDVDEAVSLASRVYVLRGTPSAGVPSQIVAEVKVPRTQEEGFELTHAYVDCKRAIMDELG